MAHIPVNHRLRPLYRTLAALIGLYILVFGLVGIFQSSGTAFFGHENVPWVLGLRANPAFSVLSILCGILVFAGAVLGRNVDHLINIAVGIVMWVAGVSMLLLLRTDANFLGFSMTNCVVSLIFGTTLVTAGLYGKTGTAEDAAAEEEWRHAGSTV